MAHQEIIGKEMKDCIDICSDCHKSCLETITHCLSEGAEHKEHGHISLLQVCAEVCELSARTMLAGSDFHTRTCEICAEICEQCVDECDSFDDQAMKACADTCRKCAESCRAMAGKGLSHRKVSERTQSASL